MKKIILITLILISIITMGAYNPNIPQATDTLSTSQADILANFQAIGGVTTTGEASKVVKTDALRTLTLDNLVTSGYTVLNENGGNEDFRVESDNRSHMLFLDADLDRIGINDSTPSYDFDINGDLGVVQTAYITNIEVSNKSELSGNLTVGGTLGVTGATTLTGEVTTNGWITANGNIRFNQFTDRSIQDSGNFSMISAGKNIDLTTVGDYNITVSPNATTALQVDGSGNVLIGTTTDAGEKLQISGASVKQYNNSSDVLHTIKNTNTAGTRTSTLKLTPQNDDSYTFQVQTSGGAGTTTMSHNGNTFLQTNLVGNINLGVSGQSISPTTDSAINLGTTSTLRWNNIYLINSPTVESDERVKQDIIDSDLGLNFVKQVRPVQYKLKKDDKKELRYGLIAQEVKEILGEKWEQYNMIGYDPDNDRYNMKYEQLIGILLQAVKELSIKAEEQEVKYRNLLERIEALENK